MRPLNCFKFYKLKVIEPKSGKSLCVIYTINVTKKTKRSQHSHQRNERKYRVADYKQSR